MNGIMSEVTSPSAMLTTGLMTPVDFNMLVASSAANVTEIRSFVDPPPLTGRNIRDAVTSFLQGFWVYVVLLVGNTIYHALLYGFILLATVTMPPTIELYATVLQTSPPEFLVVLTNLWEATWKAIEENWRSTIRSAFGSPGYFWFLLGILFILNSGNWLWKIHNSLYVPVGFIRGFTLWLTNYRRTLDTSNLQFGHLQVQYGYNEHGFFVRSDTNHLAVFIDYTLLKDVEFDRGFQWKGYSGTPSVKIVFADGSSPTVLQIHGAYFESRSGGTPGAKRAEEFFNGLKTKLKQRSAAGALASVGAP